MNSTVSLIKAGVDAADKSYLPWSITIDIAAILGAILWPLVILFIFLVFRKRIPSLISSLTGRITKLAFAGVSIELARPSIPGYIGALKEHGARKVLGAGLQD